MQSEIKVGIVEDELIIAEKIKNQLAGMGYLVCDPVSSYDEALEMIVSEKPDMLLLDINLNDKKDGIDLAEQVNKQHHLPFIFLTANSDAATVERAKKVRPNAFLVKPFVKEDLFTAIEIAFNNYSESKTTAETPVREFIFIRDGHRFGKLLFTDIIYVESRENYVVIHTKDKRSIITRSTFSDFIAQLPQSEFIRTHRSFIVRVKAIENIEPTEVLALDFKIPVSNTYKPDLFAALGIKE
jgi:DNA-binding LytR/AlgR family response regulator